MRVLITAGPTREPIDAVRYLSNRSSGQMGAALMTAALQHGHCVTAIVGPLIVPIPRNIQQIDVETAADMQRAVLEQFPEHDLLIMAAAVADFRPRQILEGKFPSGDSLTLQLQPTPDISALASRSKRPDQRTVAFSLESAGGIDRAREKMHRKNVDLMVFNPISTMHSPTVQAVLLYPDGRSEELGCREKAAFADILLQRAVALF